MTKITGPGDAGAEASLVRAQPFRAFALRGALNPAGNFALTYP
jgi:hypothetical protein